MTIPETLSRVPPVPVMDLSRIGDLPPARKQAAHMVMEDVAQLLGDAGVANFSDFIQAVRSGQVSLGPSVMPHIARAMASLERIIDGRTYDIDWWGIDKVRAFSFDSDDGVIPAGVKVLDDDHIIVTTLMTANPDAAYWSQLTNAKTGKVLNHKAAMIEQNIVTPDGLVAGIFSKKSAALRVGFWDPWTSRVMNVQMPYKTGVRAFALGYARIWRDELIMVTDIDDTLVRYNWKTEKTVGVKIPDWHAGAKFIGLSPEGHIVLRNERNIVAYHQDKQTEVYRWGPVEEVYGITSEGNILSTADRSFIRVNPYTRDTEWFGSFDESHYMGVGSLTRMEEYPGNSRYIVVTWGSKWLCDFVEIFDAENSGGPLWWQDQKSPLVIGAGEMYGISENNEVVVYGKKEREDRW